jgi:EAL domain-containing protein (putative c-di-GMP-specific phosphodiesterase class I)
LFEIAGPEGPVQPRPELAGRIASALAGHVEDGGLAGELAAGRYGVLSSTADGFARVAAEIEALLRGSGIDATVNATTLPLESEGLSPLQATRALRYALDSYARGGAGALAREGFDKGLAGFVSAACARADAFARMIAERRFRLAYQPIVGLADRRVHHYEALLRPMSAPGGGNPTHPQDFVTFAETVGLSEALDWAVIETCAEAARKAGGAHIACNISGLSLQSPAMRERLLGLLRAEPALVERLLIEITETAEIEDEDAAIGTVEALRALGLPLCIDDFGAGAAAFRYLRAFRVDYVKIDGQYVQAAVKSERDLGFVASMVDLARKVGAQVVAERIETEAEATAMLGLGVEYGQGWLFGKPGRLPGRL